MRIETARARDEPGPGFRVLVDRLWPRGVAKQRLPHDLWAKELTPSTDLRRWFHEDRTARHDDFVARYRAELAGSDHREALDGIRRGAARHNGLLVLVSDVKDPAASHLPVLQEWLAREL